MDPFVRANGMGGAESRVRQRLDAHNRAFCKPLQQDAVRRVSLESIEKTRLGECLLTILFVEAAQAPSRFVCKQIAVRVIFERLREARRVELTQNVITNLCRPATGRPAQQASSRRRTRLQYAPLAEYDQDIEDPRLHRTRLAGFQMIDRCA